MGSLIIVDMRKDNIGQQSWDILANSNIILIGS